MDSIEDLTDCMNYALRQCGFPEHPLSDVKKFVGNGLHKLVERAVPKNTAPDQLELCYQRMAEHYRDHSMVKSQPYAGVQDVLLRLNSHGIKTAIVTNKIQSMSQDIARSFFPMVNLVVGDDKIRPLKPAPDGVLLALQQFGCLPSEAALVGDSEVDIRTAINAGVTPIAVLWGFRSREVLTSNGASKFASSSAELLNLLGL